MPRVKMTKTWLDDVTVDRRTDFDDEIIRNLSIRVSPSEGEKPPRRIWNVRYFREGDGGRQRVKIGAYPALTLEKAREKALKLAVAVIDGDDPASAKRANREAMTVAELGALYLAKYARPNKRSWKEDERILKVEVYPKLGRMKAAAVKRRDLLDIVEAKAEAGRVRQAGLILAMTRKMFGWSVASDYLTSSPAAGMKPPGKPARRDRVLSAAELRKVWNALPTAPLSPAMADIIRLLFLTGQRSGEVSGMTRGELDLDRAEWTIPAKRAKNGREHTVPLSGAALDIVRAQIRDDDHDDGEDYPLFSRIGTPITGNAVSHAVGDRLQVLDTPWVAHDARRTYATLTAEELNIAPHIIEAALNHLSGFKAGVAGTYNRAKHLGEVRKAMDMWAERLLAIVDGAEPVVLPMKRKTRVAS